MKAAGRDSKTDFVESFVAENARQLETRPCYVAVDYLKVTAPCEVAGVRFLPPDSDEIPQYERLLSLLKDPPIGAVAVVDVTGTDRERMAERGRDRVRHALRVLRIALREHASIVDQQLRFRVGRSYMLAADLSGWSAAHETAYELELRPDLVELAARATVIALPMSPTTGIEKQADVAIRWMERATFSGEPTVALLFLFFALEALLGKSRQSRKAHLVAFRQAILSHAAMGGFAHPDRTVFLYREVRNAAVHGDDAVPVDWNGVRLFASTVRRTLDQYLRYAGIEGFRRREELLAALDKHRDRAQLVDFLRANDRHGWVEYFDASEPAGRPLRGRPRGASPA